MPCVKMNISLDADVATALKARAAELGIPTSRHLADLVRADERRRLDELAEEGYRLQANDPELRDWEEAAWKFAGEGWEWKEEPADAKAA